MTYNLKNLNVASLDFDDIKGSLTTFLQQQPDLKNLDFSNQASAVNLLLNILATATAYNGVYAQYGYLNSFASTATVLESLMGIASNCSVLLTPTLSASSTATISASTNLDEYSAFSGKAPNGSDVFFFNVEGLSAGQAKSIKLYSGSQTSSYTSYNYETQSCNIPFGVNPETISFYETNLLTGATTKWTRVDKTNTANLQNNTHFTVKNGANGYLVTNNFSTAKQITTESIVSITAVLSNGSLGNQATLVGRNGVSINTYSTPSGGFDLISINKAKSSLLFKAIGQERCVTNRDYKNAILSSGISGTEVEENITVANTSYPGEVKIYVSGLSDNASKELMSYLSSFIPVGINLVYQQ